MAKKLILGLILARFGPNLLPKISRKTKVSNLKKGQKNEVFGLILAQIWAPKIFLWILPRLDARHYCKLSLYSISRKTIEPNLGKWLET